MKLRLGILIVSFLATTQTWASFWDNLWSTPNQQGQRLMNKGQYSKAQQTFEDKAWSASAAFRASDYQKANKQFLSLKNELGYYNQGNALAYLGQYKEAIAAYDKALAINPNNQDAKDNRKLLEDLMKKNQDQNQDQNKDQNNQNNQNNQDKKNKDNQNNNNQEQQKNNQNQDNKDQDKQEQDQKDDTQKPGDKEPKKEQQNNKDQDQTPKPQDNKQEQEQQSKADKEKQQAKEQWLQLIPDDPGGLLREKFLRDHLRRERGWNQ